jgi:hypothetical protein
MKVFDQLLPRRIDNMYGGSKLALWLFGLLLLLRIVMSLGSIFNGYSVASSADGIPLEAFSITAARTVVALFALLGLSHFIICLLCILALIRYRSMVPLMFALLLLQQLSRTLILQFLPVVRTGTPPGIYLNLILLTLMIVGLALSLRSRSASLKGS